MSDLQEMLIYSTEPYLIKRNQFFKELIHSKLKKKEFTEIRVHQGPFLIRRIRILEG